MPGFEKLITLNVTKGDTQVNAWFYEGEGDFAYDIVGEASYQAGILSVLGGPLGIEGANLQKTAVIVPEPENKYDQNAMRVFIDGVLVGYLARDDAAEMVEELESLQSVAVVVCEALVVGGFSKRDGSRAHLGVKLDLMLPLD